MAMELRHLRYFVAVVEEGSQTTAAGFRLHTSQPSLSRQIRDLENQVGAELLSRSVHGVELSAAGEAFLDHARLALAQVDAIHPRNLTGEIFIGGSNKATVLRAMTEDYLRRSGIDIKLDHGVDNLAMAISLVASTRGLALMPAYANNLLPPSVISRPLEGEAPTIDLAVGYSKANTSPTLKLFLSRLEEVRAPMPEKGLNACCRHQSSR
jgi:DNA-binding transcriptional LysR family regulator